MVNDNNMHPLSKGQSYKKLDVSDIIRPIHCINPPPKYTKYKGFSFWGQIFKVVGGGGLYICEAYIFEGKD